MKKIVFVCLGNICRSPMAEFVMKSLTDKFHIESRATSNWEHGNPIHQGTQAALNEHAIIFDVEKTSLQMSEKNFAFFDYIVGMDASNVADLKKMAPRKYQDKIYQFMDKSVPDPWYTNDFDETYRLVQAGCERWLERLDG